jgi:TRAP-type uncharacterized transport system substrate-binding protein
MMAKEIAKLFAKSEKLGVVAKNGDAGLANIKRLLEDPKSDLAFVAVDALSARSAEANETQDKDRLKLVARLAPQEIHIVAGPGIAKLGDLAGRKVNCGAPGSSTALSAARLFSALNITVEPVALDGARAIEQVRRGSIAATVVVGAKPVPLIAAIPANFGLQLVPITFDAPLQDIYLPAALEHETYPNLIGSTAPVATVATGMALVAKDGGNSATRIGPFVDGLFSRLGELQAEGHHPQWREINLAARVSGIERSAAAEHWLEVHPEPQPPQQKTIKADMGGGPSLDPDRQEALFRAFVEWQRAKGQ